MPGGCPFQRKYNQTSHTLAAGTKTTVWPSGNGSDTNNKAVWDTYRKATILVRNTAGSNAITASTIEASMDGTNWTAILTNTLTPAASAQAFEILDSATHGFPAFIKITLTSSSGTTCTTDVIASR